jgi:hypothetical protein
MFLLRRIHDFVGFQNMFLRMTHQIDARELPQFNQRLSMAIIGSKKTFAVWAGHSILHVDPTKLAATKERSSVDAFAIAKNQRFC